MDLEAAVAAFVVISGAYLLLKKKKKRRQRRWWMVSLNRNRPGYSETHLMADLLKEPSGLLENFCKISCQDFEYLLQKIGPYITKKDTNCRKAIPSKERLALTLRFLATGDNYKSLHHLFDISPQLISNIVPEVCSALIRVLQDSVKIPTNAMEWKKIAGDYENLWNFPHCVGVIDGKHIIIQSPMKSGMEFSKNYLSIVLMGVVDANYCFIFAECERQGRLDDGAIFQRTELFRKIENDQLNLPPDEPLEGQNIHVPYLFVGNDAFSLSNRILKPYSGIHERASPKRIFNYRLSRACRVVENVFGIMASVFRVLRKPMLLQPEKVSLVTMTCVILHNFLRRSKTSSSSYTPHGTFDIEEEGNILPGSWREDNDNMSSLLPINEILKKPSIEVKNIRNVFADYFISNDKAVWQDTCC